MKKKDIYYLVKDRDTFRQQINQRIDSGKIIISKRIVSDPEYQKTKTEVSEWFIYTTDILKHSFNNPQNEYIEGFEKCFNRFQFFLGNQTLEFRVERQIKNTLKYISYLEELLTKIDQIPIQGI